MNHLTKLIVDYGLGDWASIVGVLLTVIGFGITIFSVWKSQSAAEKAQEAVQRVREDILRTDAVAEFSTALSIMDEIKRLQRYDAWPIVPDRYSALRKSLISIKSTCPNMSENHKELVQDAITSLRKIEEKIELESKEKEFIIDVAKYNKILSKQLDSLQEILSQIKYEVGG